MAPVPLKEIVVFSSEDPKYPAQNIIKGQKWLTDFNDKSGKAIIEVQLEKVTQIHYIDVAYCNAASLEVTVGRSSQQSSHVPLLPTVILQNPLQARRGENKTGCRMFNYPEHLNSKYASEKWDRVRFILHQPFVKHKQIGLEFVRLGSPRNVTGKMQPSTSILQTNPAQGSWRESAIAKLAGTGPGASSAMNNLQDKLLRISGTTEDGSEEKNTLSRTAKMVLSSRSGALANNLVKLEKRNPTKFAPKSPNLPQNKKIHPKFEKVHPQPKRNSNLTSSDNMHQVPTATTTKRTRPLAGLCQIPKTEKLSGFPLKVSQTNSHFPIKTEPSTWATNQSLPTTSTWQTTSVEIMDIRREDNIVKSEPKDCESTSSSSDFSKTEIKRMKRLIEKFFNTFDMEQIDPDKITLRELRTTFEALHNVTLDKDGRQYFKNVTVNYLELAMTVKRHKEKENIQDPQQPSTSSQQTSSNGTPTRKRKSDESVTIVHSPIIHKVANPSLQKQQNSSPAKVRRLSHESTSQQNSSNHIQTSSSQDYGIVSAPSTSRPNQVQCPLCMKMFPTSIITTHAAICGEDDLPPSTNDLQIYSNDLGRLDDDIQITSVIPPTRHSIHPRETTLDLSDNMRLSEEEKKHWINFTKKPKPYHARMDGELFKGCVLVKCPSCGQAYKSEEIEEHSDECAEKVNSGLQKRGLYYVTKQQKIVNARR